MKAENRIHHVLDVNRLRNSDNALCHAMYFVFISHAVRYYGYDNKIYGLFYLVLLLQNTLPGLGIVIGICVPANCIARHLI